MFIYTSLGFIHSANPTGITLYMIELLQNDSFPVQISIHSKSIIVIYREKDNFFNLIL